MSDKKHSLIEMGRIGMTEDRKDPNIPLLVRLSAKPQNQFKGGNIHLGIAEGTVLAGKLVAATIGTITSVGEKHHTLRTTFLSETGTVTNGEVVVDNRRKIYS